MGIDDLFHYLKLGKKVNHKKYRLMGIKDINLIDKLLEFDNLYFTYIYLHRKDVDDITQSLRDETSTNELD